MTVRTYLASPDLQGTATVTQIARDERGEYVVLDATLFHPQGGGQRADRGTLDDVPVQFVGAVGEEIRYYVESAAAFSVGKTVRMSVDAHARALHARLHTGGHLIAALIEEAHPACRAVAGHHWPGEARVEFENLPVASPAQFAADLGARIAGAVGARLPVAVVPGAMRQIAIGAHRPVGCGGTHVADTSALAGIVITGVKEKKGRTRVSYDLTP